MVDYMNDPLHDILRDVAEDGKVDAEELELIQNRLLEDGTLDQDEMEFLFALNDIVAENEGNFKDWEEFFIEAVVSFLLNDPLSAGVLDEDEWFWLKAMIAEDGDLGEMEMRLLVEIAERSTSLPEDFDDFAKQFEHVEYAEEIGHTFLYARIAGKIADKVRKD